MVQDDPEAGLDRRLATVARRIVKLKRVIIRKLVMGIADGIMKVDGKVVYEAKGLRVALITDAAAALAAPASA